MSELDYLIIVDDDEEDRSLMIDALKESRYSNKYLEMGSGQELLDHLQQARDSNSHLPCSIILDYNLRKSNASEILSQLKANKLFTTIPVIVLSSSSYTKHRQMLYELGCSCYRHKPSSFNRMVELFNAIEVLWCVSESDG